MTSQSAGQMRRALDITCSPFNVVLLSRPVVDDVLGRNGLVRGNKGSRSSQESQLVCLNTLIPDAWAE